MRGKLRLALLGAVLLFPLVPLQPALAAAAPAASACQLSNGV
jgi:hypothetical protein